MDAFAVIGWVGGWVGGHVVDGWMDGWMDGWTGVCMYVCMYVCTYECMYACVHVYACIRLYACIHACMEVCTYACMHVLESTQLTTNPVCSSLMFFGCCYCMDVDSSIQQTPLALLRCPACRCELPLSASPQRCDQATRGLLHCQYI